MKLVPLPDFSLDTKLKYLYENAKNIDLLITFGIYPDCQAMAITYKKLNPNGLVYSALDANSFWMDRIDWTNQIFQRFLSSTDVIATSCSAIANYLSKKWKHNIYCITNGYYSFLNSHRKTKVFSEKQNRIITVGRLGTEQKATNVLLSAFAKIAKEIPEWSLRLIGTVEDSFKAFIDEIFYRKSRVERQSNIYRLYS